MNRKLYGCQELAFLSVVRVKSHRPLKDCHRVIKSFELHEASGVCMQRVELRVEKLASFLEMRGRRSAVSLPILQHGQHGVAGGIAGTQLQQTIEQRHCIPIARLVLYLSSTG